MKKIGSFIILLLAFQPVIGQDFSEFEKTLRKHLAAIEEKNITDISATVSDSVTLIFPDGSMLKSKEKFMEFHKKWFGDPSWKMAIQVVSAENSDSLGYALIKYRYEKSKENEIQSVHHTYLLLIFKKIKGKWLLWHDQNTQMEK